MNRKLPVAILLLSCLALSFTVKTKEPKWQSLFNGKDLAGWDAYLGPDLDDNGKPITKEPLGLNNDPRHVFTVVKEDGQPAIHVSGDGWGAIISKKEYENYHLTLQFKWGKLLWGQKKKGNKKDSGLLYHSVGAYGADYGAWMRAQEFQIEEGNCGDYWGCAGGTADIPAHPVAKADPMYDPQASLIHFTEGAKDGRHCTKQGTNYEVAPDQWNTLDLYCHGDTSIHVVNGHLTMILYHNSQTDKGVVTPMTKGRIQLQSEGSEIYFRRVLIKPIDALPAELVNQK